MSITTYELRTTNYEDGQRFDILFSKRNEIYLIDCQLRLTNYELRINFGLGIFTRNLTPGEYLVKKSPIDSGILITVNEEFTRPQPFILFDKEVNCRGSNEKSPLQIRSASV